MKFVYDYRIIPTSIQFEVTDSFGYSFTKNLPKATLKIKESEGHKSWTNKVEYTDIEEKEIYHEFINNVSFWYLDRITFRGFSMESGDKITVKVKMKYKIKDGSDTEYEFYEEITEILQ